MFSLSLGRHDPFLRRNRSAAARCRGMVIT